MSSTETPDRVIWPPAQRGRPSVPNIGGHGAAQSDRLHGSTVLLTGHVRLSVKQMRLERNVEIRPLGGGVDYPAMIFFSVIASVLLTVEVSVLARL